MASSHLRVRALGLPALTLALLVASSGLALPRAHAAQVLVVLDSGADMGIATALMADGHTVTVSPTRFAAGSNAALLGDLSAYDVIFWSQSGTGSGDAVTDAALFTNLSTWVTGGGRILVTGYDSVASPSDPMLVAFLGASGSADVPGAPGVIASIDNSLTTGVVDIRGLTPTGGQSDQDHLTGLAAGTTSVTPSASGSGTQWALRTLGSGQIAFVANGSSSASWTNTTSGGAGAYNAAIRNFAGSVGSACTGEGMACTSGSGRVGVCYASRCCTGCWDGTRCNGGTTGTACGVEGRGCSSCADGDACSSDVCTTGVCSNPDAPAGTACDDGLFCTPTDVCDGARACGGSGVRCNDSSSCTDDSCDEATDACLYVPAVGCAIAGVCLTDGTVNPSNPCEVCDHARSPTAWSPAVAGTDCGPSQCSMGRVQTRYCNATGTCVVSVAMSCPTGMCADAMVCQRGCTEGSCAAGMWCNPATAYCQMLRAAGRDCAVNEECTSGACADGVCCDVACDGECEACNVAGSAGSCMPYAMGADPELECGATTCDGAGACLAEDAGPGDGGTSSVDGGGVRMDSGVIPVPDAGLTPPGSTGCACSVPAGADGGRSLALFGLAALALAVRARRRR